MRTSVPRAVSTSQGAISLKPVAADADRRQFVELPYTLYAANPHWVPPLRRDEHRRLSTRHNPFHEHADMQLWLARRHGRVVGRIAAIDDRLHNDTHNERVTWFGFFEADDGEVAARLLAAVETHAARRGSRLVRGPANPSLHESAGLLIDAFDEDPYVLMPYNPASYAQFLEGAGYRKIKDLLAWDLDARATFPRRLERVAARAARRSGIRLRTVRLTAEGFAQDLQHLKTIYRSAWAPNWGFVPPTDAEIEQLARDLRPVLDPNLIIFAELGGELSPRVVGVGVAIPDFNQVLKRMNGRLWPLGVLHYLRRKQLITRVRVLLLGVLPGFQGKGLYPLLISGLHRNAQAAGYTRAELSWTLEDNEAVNAGIAAVGGRRYKTYRLYEKPVG